MSTSLCVFQGLDWGPVHMGKFFGRNSYWCSSDAFCPHSNSVLGPLKWDFFDDGSQSGNIWERSFVHFISLSFGVCVLFFLFLFFSSKMLRPPYDCYVPRRTWRVELSLYCRYYKVYWQYCCKTWSPSVTCTSLSDNCNITLLFFSV